MLLKIVLVAAIIFLFDYVIRTIGFISAQIKKNGSKRTDFVFRQSSIGLSPLENLTTAKLFELDQSKLYIFWWEQVLPQKHIEAIDSSLKKLGLRFRIFMGPGRPNIYEYRNNAVSKVSSDGAVPQKSTNQQAKPEEKDKAVPLVMKKSNLDIQ